MSELNIECPHCGTNFCVQLQGKISNMMVFCCSRCQTPLMYFHGVVSELDRDEFANLRKRLSLVLDAEAHGEGSMAQVAETLRKMVEESDKRAAERAAENACVEESAEHGTALSDESLDELQKQLNELDAESFLDNL